MNLTVALLADAANSSDNGKLNMLGVFQNLFTPTVPVGCTGCLVILLRADPMERGTRQNVKIELVDADGKTWAEMENIQVIVPDVANVLTPDANLIVHLAGLVLPQFGMYDFKI